MSLATHTHDLIAQAALAGDEEALKERLAQLPQEDLEKPFAAPLLKKNVSLLEFGLSLKLTPLVKELMDRGADPNRKAAPRLYINATGPDSLSAEGVQTMWNYKVPLLFHALEFSRCENLLSKMTKSAREKAVGYRRASAQSMELMELMLPHCSNETLAFTDPDGNTLLHYLQAGNHSYFRDLMDKEYGVLYENGNDVAIAEAQRQRLIEKITDAGANPEQRNAFGYTAKEFAGRQDGPPWPQPSKPEVKPQTRPAQRLR